MAFAIGYTNASWTLKVDLVCPLRDPDAAASCARTGYATVTPRLPADGMRDLAVHRHDLGLLRAVRASLPLQGDRAPWRLRQHYFKDATLYRGPIDEENLKFSPAPAVLEPAS